MSKTDKQTEISQRAEGIEKAIDDLKESWSDLYSHEKKVGNRAD